MESEVESIISPNPHNTKIYSNLVIVVETKSYQIGKLKSLYSGLLVHIHWTPFCAVSYVMGYFSCENHINYKEDGLLYCIQVEKRKLTLQNGLKGDIVYIIPPLWPTKHYIICYC